VLRIGLTGGIGSGKSTVSALLAERGAVVVDADRIAREVVEPGSPGLAAVVEAFGPQVLTPDGALDRPALAAVVFADPEARARLDGIVHPLVRHRTAELVAAAPADAVVVNDVPLLVETGQAPSYDLVLVVEADPEIRVARLVQRGLAEEDARARIAAQATDEQRRAVADVVLDNSGTPEQLAEQVDRFWTGCVQPVIA
jgi:dephospho-CoA kinase